MENQHFSGSKFIDPEYHSHGVKKKTHEKLHFQSQGKRFGRRAVEADAPLHYIYSSYC